MNKMDTIKKTALVINFVIGIGALFGGAMALLPGMTDAMGMTSDTLKHAPFKTFLIPGLFLLIVIAGGNLFNGISFLRKRYNSPFYVILLGVIMMLWIVLQSVMMWSVVPLHIIFFCLGAIQSFCGYQLIKRQKLTLPFSAKQN